MDEENSKAEGRGEMTETELLIMDQFTILIRDLYAFYPLLIRFVDYNRYVKIPQLSEMFNFINTCSCLLLNTYVFKTWELNTVIATLTFLQYVVSVFYPLKLIVVQVSTL